MTIQEKLTAEFKELDRVTPRPLTHEDYAIAAIQFFTGTYASEAFNRAEGLEVKIEQLQKHLNETDEALHVCHNQIKDDVKLIQQLREDRERLLSDKGEQMEENEMLIRKNTALVDAHTARYNDLMREHQLVSADRDTWKDRYGKLVVDARHADEDEIKGLRYSVEYLTLQIKQLKEDPGTDWISRKSHEGCIRPLIVRKDSLEEWLTEYRDHLRKVDFKEKQTLINEITELLNGSPD